MEEYSKYLNAISKKYHAVCLSVEGTITDAKTPKVIDADVVKSITNILKRKCAVIFIANSESELKLIKEDLYRCLTNDRTLIDDDIGRIYVIDNKNREFISSIGGYPKKRFLVNNIKLDKRDSARELLLAVDACNKYYNFLEKFHVNSVYRNYFYIDQFKESKFGDDVYFQLTFNTTDQKIVDYVYEEFKNKIASSNFSDAINYALGMEERMPIIEFGVNIINTPLKEIENIIGVKEKTILRVGTSGKMRIAEVDLLDSPCGVNIDKEPSMGDKGSHIYDNNKNILKGVEATKYALNNGIFVPLICLEKVNREKYEMEFALAEKDIIHKNNQNIGRGFDLSHMIEYSYDCANGIYGLFDRYSGGVIVPMYEWLPVKNNHLKNFWATYCNNKYVYSLEDDHNHILRGSNTYYYFLERIIEKGSKVITKDEVLEWYRNYIEFFCRALDALKKQGDILNSSLVDRRFILGILDNCRNVLLILLNYWISETYKDQNILVELNDKNMLYSTLVKVEREMRDMCTFYETTKERTMFLDDIISDIKNTTYVMRKYYDYELALPEKENYFKYYRPYRELDNFGEIYSSAESLSKSYRKTDTYFKRHNDLNPNLCGMCYGGMELPILARATSINDDRVFLLKFNSNTSNYMNRKTMDLSTYGIKDFGGLIYPKELEGQSIRLFDDNILTGKTLQYAINSLADYGIGVSSTHIVKFPDANRLDQMFFGNTTAVNVSLFGGNFFSGLNYMTDYVKKDTSWYSKDGSIDGYDSSGVCDANMERIIKYLSKNQWGNNEESEIARYKKKLVGRK